MTTPYSLEQAEEDIAELRGLVDKTSEIIQTVTLTATGPVTATGGTATVPSLIETDTWHSLGTLANYTVTLGRYRLTVDNCVELDIEVSTTGTNAASPAFSNTLPAAYRPLNDRRLPLATTKTTAAGDNPSRLFVQSSTGSVQVVQTASSSANLGCCVRIPLD